MQNEFYDYETTTGGVGAVLSGQESIKIEHSVAVPWEVFGAFALISLVLIMARYAFKVS